MHYLIMQQKLQHLGETGLVDDQLNALSKMFYFQSGDRYSGK